MPDDRRSSRVTLFVIAVALILGLGLAYWLLHDEDEGQTGDRAALDERGRVERTVVTDSKRSDSRGASIRGKVVDEHDAPIAGAQVCASPLRAGRLSLAERRRRHCTISDTAGRFSLDELAAVELRISASARAHVPARLDVWARDQEVTLRLLTGGVAVRGRVFDLAGGVIAGAWVSPADHPAGVATDDDGAFEIWTAPGRRYLFASSAGYVPNVVEIAAPMDGAEIYLAPGSSIHGKVVDADSGEPLAGVSIRAVLESNVFISVLANAYGGATVTDDQGNFEIDRLSAGRFSLIVDDREAYGRYPGTVGLRLGAATGPVEVEARLRSGTAFSGRLVDADSGEPVQGCQLELSPAVRGDGPHGWLETDPNGHFEGRFPPGDYRPRVEMFCPTHVMPDDEPLLTLGTQPRDDLVFELQPAAVIAGTLLDDQDRPFLDASVRVQSERHMSFRPTQADGTFRFAGLPPGTYELRAQSEESPAKAEPETYELRPGESLTDIELVLPRGATVTGTLTDQSGAGIEGATISAVGSETREAKTLASGRFSINGLADGSYVFKAKLDDGGVLRTPDASDDVLASQAITAADSPVSIDLRAERATATITGEVVDEDGPVGDAYVIANRESAGSPAIAAVNQIWDRRPALTDVDGSFTLSGLPEGKYTIRAFRKDGTEGYAEHVNTGTSTTITFEPTVSLSGTARDGEGNPLTEFTIHMRDESGGGFRRETFMATEGEFRIDGLRPGTWTVVLRAGGRDITDEVTLDPGEDETGYELALATGVEVTGKVVDAVTGRGVPDILVRAGLGRSATTDADGRFALSDVPPGKATLSARTRSFLNEGDYMTGWIIVTVPEQGGDVGELPIVPRTLEPDQNPGDFGITLEQGQQPSATIATVRPGSPAAEAGVSEGCTISQMNDRAIEGNAALVHGFLHVPEGTVVTLSCAGDPTVYSITAGPPR